MKFVAIFLFFSFSFWTYYSRIENAEKYHITKVTCYSHKHVMSHKVVTMMTIGK